MKCQLNATEELCPPRSLLEARSRPAGCSDALRLRSGRWRSLCLLLSAALARLVDLSSFLDMAGHSADHFRSGIALLLASGEGTGSVCPVAAVHILISPRLLHYNSTCNFSVQLDC